MKMRTLFTHYTGTLKLNSEQENFTSRTLKWTEMYKNSSSSAVSYNLNTSVINATTLSIAYFLDNLKMKTHFHKARYKTSTVSHLLKNSSLVEPVVETKVQDLSVVERT